jgi:hypothetical protein
VPVKGDILDESFAQFVNADSHNVMVQRLKDGQYMYGSKKIFAKIMNEKLVIRVNGGYMLIEEFLKTYGESESKLQTIHDQVIAPLNASSSAIGARSPKRVAGAGSPKRVVGAGSPRGIKRAGSPKLGF